MKMHHDTEDRIDHQVPLSEPVIRILMGLKSDHKPTDYIFTNGHGRPLYEPAMLRQCRKIRSDVSVHGFRSTFRDWCGDMTEHDSQTAELALAHKVKGVEGRYRRKTALEKRHDLMIRWSQYCDGESNVVPLKKAV
jgi:integrase